MSEDIKKGQEKEFKNPEKAVKIEVADLIKDESNTVDPKKDAVEMRVKKPKKHKTAQERPGNRS